MCVCAYNEVVGDSAQGSQELGASKSKHSLIVKAQVRNDIILAILRDVALSISMTRIWLRRAALLVILIIQPASHITFLEFK